MKRHPPATKFARVLRRKDNEAEARLWASLRNRRLHGFKFVREFPIKPYFADFACREQWLVVEVDGSQHADSTTDVKRDTFLNAVGWSVIRFWHADVLQDREAVLATIVEVLEGRFVEKTIARDVKFLPAGDD